MNRRGQSGFVLLALLVLLLGAGGGWLGVVAHSGKHSVNSADVSLSDLQSLIDARQALLSYAAMYPFLYGPAGAGPAHLPCPDTDGYAHRSASVESGLRQRRDGPNPPCTSLLSSDGLMPRHINLPGHRYAFHSQPWQRFHYSVVGKLVNNPLNRVVNLQVLREQESSLAAVIGLPLSDEPPRFANSVLTHKSLVDASVPAVAGWIIQTVSDKTSNMGCKPSAGKVRLGVSASKTGSIKACLDEREFAPVCPAEHLLSLILDKPIVSADSCLSENLQHNTIEGVPAQRHWFVRNRWYIMVSFVYGDGCVPDSVQASLCKLVYPSGSRRVIAGGGNTIALHWLLPA